MGVHDILTHNDLDSALKNKQLQVAFQPCISLSKLSALGGEAFLRWQHPALGLLPANLFMPFARAQGRTREVATFVLRETLRAVSEWRRAGLQWKAYVNVDGADLADGMLADSIALLLCEFEVPAEALTLDIRETDFAERGAQFLPHIAALRTMGVGIALDTVPGEAPLQDISSLPLTEMKIAGPAIIRFVEMTQDTGLGRIMHRLDQAREAGLLTCAMRVESEATLWALQRVGFDAAQGAYISRPLPLTELVRWDHIWRKAAAELTAQKQRPAPKAPVSESPAERKALEAQLSDRIEDPSAPITLAADDETGEVLAPVFGRRAPEPPPPEHTGSEPLAAEEAAPVAEADDFAFDAPGLEDEAREPQPVTEAAAEVEPGTEMESEAEGEDIGDDAEAASSKDFSFDASPTTESDVPPMAEFTFDAHAADLPPPVQPEPAQSMPHRRAEPVAREPALTGPPANFKVHRKTTDEMSAPASVAGRTEKTRGGADKPATLEPVLIERRIPGLAKPIVMQVAQSGHEGRGLFGRRKSSGKN